MNIVTILLAGALLLAPLSVPTTSDMPVYLIMIRQSTTQPYEETGSLAQTMVCHFAYDDGTLFTVTAGVWLDGVRTAYVAAPSGAIAIVCVYERYGLPFFAYSRLPGDNPDQPFTTPLWLTEDRCQSRRVAYVSGAPTTIAHWADVTLRWPDLTLTNRIPVSYEYFPSVGDDGPANTYWAFLPTEPLLSTTLIYAQTTIHMPIAVR